MNGIVRKRTTIYLLIQLLLLLDRYIYNYVEIDIIINLHTLHLHNTDIDRIDTE